MMLVEGNSFFVFRVDEHRECSRFGTEPFRRSIGEQGAAQPLATKADVHGQSAHSDGRDGRVARELFGDRYRQVRRWNAGRRERVVPRDDVRLGVGDETVSDTTSNVLRDLYFEIPIGSFGAARKLLSVMLRERFDEETQASLPAE
jgi:hypothetical protein